MKIKTYTVETLSEAVERIKRELGPQAVILSTRKVPANGKWWGKAITKLEVTAAVDPDVARNAVTGAREGNPAVAAALANAAHAANNANNPRPGANMRLLQRITEEQLQPVRDELRVIREFLTAMNAQKPNYTAAAVTPTAATDTAIRDPRATVQAPRAASTNAATPVRAPQSATPTQSASPANVGTINPSAVMELCRVLLWHRLEGNVVERVADMCLQQPGAMDLMGLRDLAAKWLMDRMPSVAPVTVGGGERIITVVGPTGSGKTTSLVKLASQFVLEQKRSVALITLDHFRIGAEEQLRKYADILQVPCALAQDTLQLRRLVEQYANVDYVLIDTTGRSPADTEGMRRIEQSLAGVGPDWRALVVPATLQGDDLQHTLSQFAVLRYNRLMITKLDEAQTYGSLLNATTTTQVPLAYFTTGQQVPEDIEVASPERVVDCLFNFSGMFPGPGVFTPPAPAPIVSATSPDFASVLGREELQ